MERSEKDIEELVFESEFLEPAIALRIIKTKFDQAGIEKMQDDWLHDKPELSDELCSLIGDISDTEFYSGGSKEYSEMTKLVVGAMNRRDAPWLHMLANELFAPNTERLTPQWYAKLKAISEGKAKPALHLIVK